jgi:hypothetical protein
VSPRRAQGRGGVMGRGVPAGADGVLARLAAGLPALGGEDQQAEADGELAAMGQDALAAMGERDAQRVGLGAVSSSYS